MIQSGMRWRVSQVTESCFAVIRAYSVSLSSLLSFLPMFPLSLTVILLLRRSTSSTVLVAVLQRCCRSFGPKRVVPSKIRCLIDDPSLANDSSIHPLLLLLSRPSPAVFLPVDQSLAIRMEFLALPRRIWRSTAKDWSSPRCIISTLFRPFLLVFFVI